MTELIFIRHGETDRNVKGTYCGWTDVELNERGLQQAAQARDKLAALGIRPNFLFSSPLSRAAKTAAIINEAFNLEIRYDDRLKERHFGIWEDLTYDQICEGHPEERVCWEKDWAGYCIPEGESAKQAFERGAAFLKDVLAAHKNQTLLVAAHWGSIVKMLVQLLELPMESIWRFNVDNGGIVRVWVNDSGFAYLKGLNL